MKIVGLTAENVQKIKAFHLEPKDNMIVIGGANAQGKSSVLDSIIMALNGGRSVTEKPLREGTEQGYAKIVLDDYIITRTFNNSGGSQLTIKNKDGAVFSKPQEMLDKLIGKIAFNPLEFANAKTEDQVNILKSLIPFDFVQYETARKGKYDERTMVNKEVKTLEAELSGIQFTPDVVEVSVTELLKELDTKDRQKREYEAVQRTITDYQNNITAVRAKIDELSKELNLYNTRLTSSFELLNTMENPDTTELKTKIANAEKTSSQVMNNKRFTELNQKLSVKKQEQVKLNEDIDKLDKDKMEAIAGVKLPITGLNFSEESVMYNNIPFSMASSAEKLRISVALGMALNPQLRVLTIKDGSLLDMDNLKIIEEMAKENDYQIWIERVGRGPEMTVIMVDGENEEELLFKTAGGD